MKTLPTIYALSLWQPWASLMWLGAKRIETRSWKPPRIGIFIAIHAAKKWDELLKLQAKDPKFAKYLGAEPCLPRGCFGGIVYLSTYYSTLYKAPDKNDDEFWFGDYSPGRYGWVCPQVWRFSEPITARGQQGMWQIETEVIDALSDRDRQSLLTYWRSASI